MTTPTPTDLPEALRLADCLQSRAESIEHVNAAAELRRLHAALSAPAPAVALPRPGSAEASAMIDSLLAEYNWPSNTKNAARAGFEAARRLLAAQPSHPTRNMDSTAGVQAQAGAESYPPMPAPTTYQIAEIKGCEYGDAIVGWRVEPSHGSYAASMRPKRTLYTADQMRAFADATAALRARGAVPQDQQPSDEEILEAAADFRPQPHFDQVGFAREVLARWGAAPGSGVGQDAAPEDGQQRTKVNRYCHANMCLSTDMKHEHDCPQGRAAKGQEGGSNGL